ncbi:hypothetical protein PP427_gp159 [Salmonella phage KM16]|nr:hypothetical protein PP427_gp159 [Salmonella phage KM16]
MKALRGFCCFVLCRLHSLVDVL